MEAQRTEELEAFRAKQLEVLARAPAASVEADEEAEDVDDSYDHLFRRKGPRSVVVVGGEELGLREEAVRVASARRASPFLNLNTAGQELMFMFAAFRTWGSVQPFEHVNSPRDGCCSAVGCRRPARVSHEGRGWRGGRAAGGCHKFWGSAERAGHQVDGGSGPHFRDAMNICESVAKPETLRVSVPM